MYDNYINDILNTKKLVYIGELEKVERAMQLDNVCQNCNYFIQDSNDIDILRKSIHLTLHL